jgi:hypothetical protein
MSHPERGFLHAQFPRRLRLRHLPAQMRLMIFGMLRAGGRLPDDFQRQFTVKLPPKRHIRNPADFLPGVIRV